MKYIIMHPDEDVRNMSSEAKGVLLTMLNVPENDYCTVEKLHTAMPADSFVEICSALNELVKKNYVLKIEDKIYAVNKRKIPEMQVV